MTIKVMLALGLIMTPLFASAALDTQNKKYSYALGVSIARQLDSQGMSDIELPVFLQAVEDVLSGKDSQLSVQQMSQALMAQRAIQAEKKKARSAKSIEEGKAFLAANKAKPGVQTLASGLQYRVEKNGTGDSPKAGERVKVHYHGTLPDGTEFDSSVTRGAPAEFSVDGVIKGFSEALMLMKPGAKWRVFVPSELGYGARGAGGKIGPNQVLIFDLELIEVL